MSDELGFDEAEEEVAGQSEAAIQQPADSPIKIERFPDGLTIQIPASGLVRGTHGLFVIAVIGNIILALFSVGLLAALLGGNAKEKNAAVVLPLFLSLFWLTGVILLLVSINMGLRRVVIAVTGGTLMIFKTGLLGSKQREWEPGDVEAIRTGPSGIKVNNKPLLELRIYDGGGHKFGLLAGRSTEELNWIASELRTALHLPVRAS